MTTLGTIVRSLATGSRCSGVSGLGLSNLQGHHPQLSCLSLAVHQIRKKSAETASSPSAADLEKAVRESISDHQERQFDKAMPDPANIKHFRKPLPPSVSAFTDPTMVRKEASEAADSPPVGTHAMPHPIWSEEELHVVKVTHRPPEGIIDRLAFFSVKGVRRGFDALSGYNRRMRDERVWLNRICFLETVAGVPGMVGGMVRHLNSLRRMKRDHGWIHTLLEEAENERMHLMTAMQLKQPSLAFRTGVVVSQGIFVTFFSVAYMVSPRFCHRFVGYLEEEAVKTYTKCLEDIETGTMQHWKTQPAPELAITYWNLVPHATMKDVVLAIRADEAHHRIVNHTLGSMREDDYNPYKPGQ